MTITDALRELGLSDDEIIDQMLAGQKHAKKVAPKLNADAHVKIESGKLTILDLKGDNSVICSMVIMLTERLFDTMPPETSTAMALRLMMVVNNSLEGLNNEK